MRTWPSQAIAHWKEFQPKRYQELKKSGLLKKEAEAAAELTRKELEDLMRQGATFYEAWEQVRERYLFPKGELQEEKEKPEPGAYEALKEAAEILAAAEEED